MKFCLQYALSHTIFDYFLTLFPKNNTRSAFYGLLQCKEELIFFIIQNKMATHYLSLDCRYIPIFSFSLLM